MSKPKRIQRRRVKGWKMPKGAIYVGRPTKWGNPITERKSRKQVFNIWNNDFSFPKDLALQMAEQGWRENAVNRYEEYIENIPGFIDDVRKQLRGKDLACWCAEGEPCHADVLLRLANA